MRAVRTVSPERSGHGLGRPRHVIGERNLALKRDVLCYVENLISEDWFELQLYTLFWSYLRDLDLRGKSMKPLIAKPSFTLVWVWSVLFVITTFPNGCDS